MGIAEAIRGLNQVAWPKERDPQSATAGRSPGRDTSLTPDNPDEARTPREALAYIERLHRAGRMGELAALLRRSSVFRAAWLALQRSSPPRLEPDGGLHPEAANPGAAPGLAHPAGPVMDAGPPLPETLPGLDQVNLQAAAGRGSPPGRCEVAPDPGLLDCPVPSRPPSRAPALGRQLYEQQQRYYAREQDLQPRFSIRV